MTAVIQLDANLLVGRGLHREVYRHPNEPQLCLKVRFNSGETEERREQTYYRLLQRRQVSWDMLPRFYGNVNTSLGSAAVFDLVKDFDDTVSRSMENYLLEEDYGDTFQSALVSSLISLKKYLIQQNIITMTIKPKNLLVQRLSETEFRTVIVDNVGNSDFLPVANYVRGLGRLKILRKWKRFKQQLAMEFPGNNRAARVAACI